MVRVAFPLFSAAARGALCFSGCSRSLSFLFFHSLHPLTPRTRRNRTHSPVVCAVPRSTASRANQLLAPWCLLLTTDFQILGVLTCTCTGSDGALRLAPVRIELLLDDRLRPCLLARRLMFCLELHFAALTDTDHRNILDSLHDAKIALGHGYSLPYLAHSMRVSVGLAKPGA